MPEQAGKIVLSEIQEITFRNLPRDYPWAGSTAVAKTRAWRSAEIPAVNGHGNARSIAEIHCILANGGVARGKRVISEAGCRKALEQQIEGPDLVMSRMPPARFGMGFALPGPLLELELPNPNTIHWGGGGCSWIFIDMDARTTFAYAANKVDRRPFRRPRRHTLAAGGNLAPVLPLRGAVAPVAPNVRGPEPILVSQLPTAGFGVTWGNFLLERRALSLVVTRRP